MIYKNGIPPSICDVSIRNHWERGNFVEEIKALMIDYKTFKRLNMKKLIYLLLAFLFFSCEKNEVVNMTDVPDMNNISGTRAVSSDVTVENGCLVLKDWHVLDSIENMCTLMTDEEQTAWENSLGFESAYTYFMPYFDAFDALSEKEEKIKFQEKYKDILGIVNTGEYCDVEYPFDARGRAAILSKDGKIKIGNTLWIYQKNRKVTIENATEERISKYADAMMSDEATGVFVDYYTRPKARKGQPKDHQTLYDTIFYNTDKGRAYKMSLDLLPERQDGKLRYTLGLYQQSFRNGSTYKTRYSCQILKFRANGETIDVSNYEKITSPRGHGGRYFYIAITENDIVPNFDIEISHSSQGVGVDKPFQHEYRKGGWQGRFFLRMRYSKS